MGPKLINGTRLGRFRSCDLVSSMSTPSAWSWLINTARVVGGTCAPPRRGGVGSDLLLASALDGLTRHSSSSSITVISRVAAPAAPRAFSSTSTPYPKTFSAASKGTSSRRRCHVLGPHCQAELDRRDGLGGGTLVRVETWRIASSRPCIGRAGKQSSRGMSAQRPGSGWSGCAH